MKHIFALISLFVAAVGVAAAPQDESCVPSDAICVLNPDIPGDDTSAVGPCANCCSGISSPQIIGNTGVSFVSTKRRVTTDILDSRDYVDLPLSTV